MKASITANVLETGTKNIIRNPSIPKSLAVTAAKLAAPAVSQIQKIHSVNEVKKSVAINATNDERENNNESSEEGFIIFLHADFVFFLNCDMLLLKFFRYLATVPFVR